MTTETMTVYSTYCWMFQLGLYNNFFQFFYLFIFFGNMPVTILYVFKLHFLHRLRLDSFISREHFQTASVSLSTLLKMAGQSQKEKFQFVWKTVSLGLLLQWIAKPIRQQRSNTGNASKISSWTTSSIPICFWS